MAASGRVRRKISKPAPRRSVRAGKKSTTPANGVRARKSVLANGLKVVAVEMPHVHSVSLVAYVRAGSRYENAETNGVSHFLEHMFFRGTENYPSTYELAHRIESLGAAFNATTTRDMAYYFSELAPRHLEAGVEVIAEMFRAPLFPDVDIEREVVLEEMSDDYNEDGVLVDPDSIAKQKLWPNHPLGMPIIGVERNIKRFTAEDLRKHHRRLYTARNMVLTAAGNVSLDELERLAAKHLSFLDGTPPPATQISPVYTRGDFHFIKNSDNQVALDVVFPAFPEGSPEWRSAVMLRRILDDGISSRLHRAIVDRGGLAYGCEAILDGFHDVGTFEFECSLAPEKMSALVRELVKILKDLKEKGPEPQELAKVQERYACDLEFALDSVGEMSGWYGGVELYRTPETMDEALAKVRAVTIEDVRDIARRIFDPKRAHLVVVGEPAFKDLDDARKRLAEL